MHTQLMISFQVTSKITVFAKVFRSLPDIRSGKQIFFTSPNKNLPDRIKRADLVKKNKSKKLFYHHFYCIVLKTIHINKS